MLYYMEKFTSECDKKNICSDEDVYYDQIKYWTVKIYQANLHLQDTIS